MPDILDQITARRRTDYERLGPTFGCTVPDHRRRPVVPFLAESGTILEIKRASPSKGDIAPDLDPVELAGKYASAGTKNVSVLTEQVFFKGSLDDLVAVSGTYFNLSFLRKDFILYEDEIEVSFRAGADAVLLIARILDTKLLRVLAARCRSFGMTPFIEVREEADLVKLEAAARDGPVVAGVNTRDLATFRIDPLVPAMLRTRLPCRTVFESGASTPGACRFARQLGFDGLLIGEAAAKNPDTAGSLVSAFVSARPDWVGQFWREIGRRTSALHESGTQGRPLVKVCGLTHLDDALTAADCGADLLGFVCAESPRKADERIIRDVASRLDSVYGKIADAKRKRPLLVAVITETESDVARMAFSLVRDGILDAIQYHGESYDRDLQNIDAAGGNYGIGRYTVVRLGSDADIERIDRLAMQGEPRVLIDARVEGIAGGTGKTIPRSLVRKVADRGGLWLAGGIHPLNVRQYIDEFSPELIDVSSGLESSPGRKDHVLIKSFFREIDRENVK